MVLLSLPYTLWLVPEAAMAGDMKFHTYVQLANHGFLFFLGGLVAQARARIPWRFTRLSFCILGAGLGLVFSRYIRNFYDHFVVMEGPPRYAFAALCLGMVALFAFRDFPRVAPEAGRAVPGRDELLGLPHPPLRPGGCCCAWRPAGCRRRRGSAWAWP